MTPALPARRLSLGAALLFAACGSPECLAGPLCDDGNPPAETQTVASVQLSSPIDSVMAVGRTVQMSAVARDAAGAAVSGATFAWSAAPPSILAVTTAGVVTGVAAGSGSVQATASGVTGSYSIRAVDADLPGVTATLADGFVAALVGGLDAATAASVTALLASCAGSVTAGNVLAVETCILSALAAGGTGSGNDAARLAVIDLFLAAAQQQLQLGR